MTEGNRDGLKGRRPGAERRSYRSDAPDVEMAKLRGGHGAAAWRLHGAVTFQSESVTRSVCMG